MSPYRAEMPERLAAAREQVAADEYLSQSRCVDVLLDLRVVCSQPSVIELIDTALREIAHLRVIVGRYFRGVLDQIGIALAVEHTFATVDAGVDADAEAA